MENAMLIICKNKQLSKTYLLLFAAEPVVFSVNEADAGGVITIKFENMPQKGQVKIHKTGEKGISTVEKEGKYGKYVDIQYDQIYLCPYISTYHLIKI